MDKSKLDNLINFSFNFHRCSDINFLYQSPDYIMEKWDKYIGIRPDFNNINFNCNEEIKINEYYNIWGDSFINKKIILFIFRMNNSNFLPSNIIDIFEETTGIDKSNITTDKYLHLHTNLIAFKNKWLETTVIKRDYKLNLLT